MSKGSEAAVCACACLCGAEMERTGKARWSFGMVTFSMLRDIQRICSVRSSHAQSHSQDQETGVLHKYAGLQFSSHTGTHRALKWTLSAPAGWQDKDRPLYWQTLPIWRTRKTTYCSTSHIGCLGKSRLHVFREGESWLFSPFWLRAASSLAFSQI